MQRLVGGPYSPRAGGFLDTVGEDCEEGRWRISEATTSGTGSLPASQSRTSLGHTPSFWASRTCPQAMRCNSRLSCAGFNVSSDSWADRRVSLPARGREISRGPHRLKRRRGREVLLRLRVIQLMVGRHGLEAIRRLIAAQRPAKRVQVRRVTIDQQLSDSLSLGERTGRQYAT